MLTRFNAEEVFVQIKIPHLADEVNEAVVTLWYVKKGDKIDKDGDLVELATDKATFNMPSPEQGVIAAILKKEGDTVKVGDVICEMEING